MVYCSKERSKKLLLCAPFFYIYAWDVLSDFLEGSIPTILKKGEK